MQLVLSEDQEYLRTTVRQFLDARSPIACVRAVVDGEAGYDMHLWKRAAVELGLVGLVVPEVYGGTGAGHIERSIVSEELGRRLVPTPFLSSAVLATDTLLALDDEDARAELLPMMVAGAVTVALAIAEGAAYWDADQVRTRATRAASSWVLDGHKTLVVDGASADLILVYAHSEEGPAFFRVEANAPGLVLTRLASFDPTREFAALELQSAPAVRLESANARAAVDVIRDRATIALAAEQLGGLWASSELAVEYAKIRVQFGRYIGSFQAVKHSCVDSLIDAELGQSAVRYAAWTVDHSPEETPLAAAMSRVVVAPAYFRVAERTIQVLGGIGYTWEHDAQLYYKRAKSTELLFGDRVEQRRALAARLEL